uniref:Putative Serum response factor n=1 Tax=Schistosoma japonicum TaxID=6182 RepID=C1LI68_SCHJA|nr:putative Serum response factor [Schistosoma japonicum]
MGTISMESAIHSVNNEANFSELSPHAYKFITECPENFSNSGDNSNHFNSDSDLDSQGGNNNNIRLINIREVNDDTSLTSIHPPCSKRRLHANDINNVTNQQLTFAEERNSCEKLTKGKQKIPIEFIADRTKRYSTFSKRKTGLMKKAVELAELTGAEVLLLVASETNHVYTFATQRLKGIIELECGKRLIQTCLSSSINSSNSSMMKSDQTDLDNLKTIHNVNRKFCKKEESTAIVNADTTLSSKDYVINDLKNICNQDNEVSPILEKDATQKLANPNHVDNFEHRINIIPNTVIDSSQTADNHVLLNSEAFCNNISQVTNISSSAECKNMVYVPVSIVPSSSQNMLTLTPLPSNLLLTAQMTTNQLLLIPKLNSLPYITSNAGNILNSSVDTSTSNSLNPYLVGFLNVDANNRSSGTSTNCVTKESSNFTSQNHINEFVNNSCKHYFKPPD